MKKLFCLGLAAATLLAGSAAQAQKKSGGARPAFDVGDNTIGLALGVGTPYSYYGGVNNSPGFFVNYDHGTFGNVGPGTIGIGGITGIQTSSYRYGNGDRARWTNFFIGVRGTYHLTLLKDKNNKFDPYGGVTFGIRAESYTNDFAGGRGDYGGAHPFAGAFVGAKYNFVKNFGAFSELGFDVCVFKIGINFNF